MRMISGSAQRQQQPEALSGAIAAHAAGHSTEAGAGAAAALTIFEQPASPRTLHRLHASY